MNLNRARFNSVVTDPAWPSPAEVLDWLPSRCSSWASVSVAERRKLLPAHFTPGYNSHRTPRSPDKHNTWPWILWSYLGALKVERGHNQTIFIVTIKSEQTETVKLETTTHVNPVARPPKQFPFLTPEGPGRACNFCVCSRIMPYCSMYMHGEKPKQNNIIFPS